MSTPTMPMTSGEHAALMNLLQVASRDSGHSRHCADFLLAWWDAAKCGGFDLAALWGLDDAI